MDSFAKKQLEKFGWVDGKGLGKKENGIVEALKPARKPNSFGVGYDLGEEYKFHWWDHVFNSAARNIQVDNSKDVVQVNYAKVDNLKIDTKRPNKLKDKNLCYGSFVKSEVLTAIGIEPCEENEKRQNQDDPLPENSINDEDIFNMCGGRTAHKAARHGHTMSGKMLRIEEQEQMFLNTGKSKKKDNNSKLSSKFSNKDSLEKCKKKRKRKIEETS